MRHQTRRRSLQNAHSAPKCGGVDSPADGQPSCTHHGVRLEVYTGLTVTHKVTSIQDHYRDENLNHVVPFHALKRNRRGFSPTLDFHYLGGNSQTPDCVFNI